MDYWQAVTKDDVYFISEEGWKIELKSVLNKKGTDIVDVICELIPKNLMIARYFPEQQEIIDELVQQKEAVIAQQQSLQEEINEQLATQEEDSEEVTNDSGKLTKVKINARLKENIEVEERKLLLQYLILLENETALNLEIKISTEALNNAVLEKYPQLSDAEIKVLVVDDKWMTQLKNDIHAELESLAQNLSQRIKTLAQRYTQPLPQLQHEVESLTAKVEAHLLKMGFPL
jgi:type I restriction enzyme M protein